MSSSISFISILLFLEYSSFVSLGRFFPTYFILFDVIVNGIVSLISLSDISLLVYRNTRDFCVLTLYPVISPNSLMNSGSFLVASSGFSMYSMWSANSDSCTSFLIWIPFIYFSSLIAMAMTSNVMLNKSVESGHLYLHPDLRGNAFSLSPLRMILVVGLVFIILREVPSMLTSGEFLIINGCWILSKAVFCIYWDDHMVFILQLDVMYHTDWFVDICG